MTAGPRTAMALGAILLLARPTLGQPHTQPQEGRARGDRDQGTATQWRSIVEKLRGESVSLTDAIAKAVEKVGGVPISGRVVTGQDGHGKVEADQATPYFVEVMCRTDDGNFRIVTVGSDGGVLHTSRAAATPRDAYQQYLASHRATDRTARPAKEERSLDLLRYRDLQGVKVQNRAGEDLGKINDLAVDPSMGEVLYAAVSSGGWLGMGDKLFAVPLDAIEVISSNRVVLGVSKQELESTSGFDEANWPIRPNPAFAVGSPAGEKRKGSGPGKGSDSRAVGSVERASNVIGMSVRNRRGEKLGSIGGIFVDMSNARVAYVVLSHGGLLGVGDQRFAVPWDSLETWQQKDKSLTLAISKSRLKNAPAVSRGDDGKWNDPDWVASVYEFHGEEPYWDQRGPMARRQ